jgi:uncharacterized Zn-binding protein involved in type VI secretion
LLWLQGGSGDENVPTPESEVLHQDGVVLEGNPAVDENGHPAAFIGHRHKVLGVEEGLAALNES